MLEVSDTLKFIRFESRERTEQAANAPDLPGDACIPTLSLPYSSKPELELELVS